MKKILIIIAALIILIAGGGWVYLTRAPSAPSEDVTTGTELTTTQPTNEAQVVINAEHIYRISQEDSQVSFEIDEVLRGEDFTVVGTTNQVAGDVVVSSEDLTNITFGPVRVNARTLKTDSTQRDGAIARAILQSETDANEFITFEATNVTPGATTVTETETAVDITGNLTISGTTQEVTFEGILQKSSDEELIGHAETTVQYQDFNLIIPEVPFVANVDNNVLLTIDFVATKVQ